MDNIAQLYNARKPMQTAINKGNRISQHRFTQDYADVAGFWHKLNTVQNTKCKYKRTFSIQDVGANSTLLLALCSFEVTMESRSDISNMVDSYIKRQEQLTTVTFIKPVH